MTDETPDPSVLAAQFAAGLVTMIEALGPLLEAVTGYKAQCIDAGFTEIDASSMAADLHREFVKALYS